MLEPCVFALPHVSRMCVSHDVADACARCMYTRKSTGYPLAAVRRGQRCLLCTHLNKNSMFVGFACYHTLLSSQPFIRLTVGNYPAGPRAQGRSRRQCFALGSVDVLEHDCSTVRSKASRNSLLSSTSIYSRKTPVIVIQLLFKRM